MRVGYTVDRDPEATRVLLLRAFAGSAWALTRRQAEERAFGRTGYTATWAVNGLRWLVEHGLVESAYDPSTGRGERTFRATRAGVAALAHWDASTPEGAA